MQMWKVVAIIVFGFSTTSAVRVRQRVDGDKTFGQTLAVKSQAEPSEQSSGLQHVHESTESYSGLADVEAFAKELATMNPQGVVAGQLAFNLEKGVEATVDTSHFTRDEEDHSLKLEVFHKQGERLVLNIGEVATPSKVPIMWALDPKTVYHFKPPQEDGSDNGRWRLYVEGIKLLPFEEGLQMYRDSGVAEACKDVSPLIAQVQCERAAFFQWYYKQFSSTFKKSEYKDYDTHPYHKIGRILSGMFGSSTKYYTIKKTGGKGNEAWEKILYSLVTIPPTAPQFFEILENSEDPGELEMGMVSVPQFEGQYGHVDCAVYKDLQFSEKNAAEFDADAFESQRKSGEFLARSGLNFGALVAKGRTLVDERVRGGTAKYILNFASPCTKACTKCPNHDPTDGCQKEHGRVYWHRPIPLA